MIIDSNKFKEIARGISQKTWDSFNQLEKDAYIKANPTSRYADPNNTLPTQIKPNMNSIGDNFTSSKQDYLNCLRDIIYKNKQNFKKDDFYAPGCEGKYIYDGLDCMSQSKCAISSKLEDGMMTFRAKFPLSEQLRYSRDYDPEEGNGYDVNMLLKIPLCSKDELDINNFDIVCDYGEGFGNVYDTVTLKFKDDYKRNPEVEEFVNNMKVYETLINNLSK